MKAIAMPPDIEVSIPGWTDVTGHTEYIIKSTAAGQQFSVNHRFSNFVELHSTLLSKLSKLPQSFPVHKSVFSGDAVKRERVDKLQKYLRNAIQLCGDERPPPSLLKFLRIEPSALGVTNAGGGGSSSSDWAASSSDPDGRSQFAAFGTTGSFTPDIPENADEALREAIKAGNSDLCLELIGSKADPNYKDRQGEHAAEGPALATRPGGVAPAAMPPPPPPPNPQPPPLGRPRPASPHPHPPPRPAPAARQHAFAHGVPLQSDRRGSRPAPRRLGPHAQEQLGRAARADGLRLSQDEVQRVQDVGHGVVTVPRGPMLPPPLPPPLMPRERENVCACVTVSVRQASVAKRWCLYYGRR